jgi:lipopolysaccharide biosynthesis glycosyltransferase
MTGHNNQSKLNLVVGLDKTYEPYTATMVKSVLDHTSSEICLHAVTECEELNTLKNLCENNAASFNLYRIDSSMFSEVDMNQHLQIPTYYRIMAPRLLRNSIDSFLYLDSDLVVQDDISSLFPIQEQFLLKASIEFERRKVMDEQIKDYFQAGVMLVNAKRGRENNYTENLLQFVQNHSKQLAFADQDAMNYVFRDETISPLEVHWNVTRGKYLSKYSLLDDAKIIHYTGPMKPWHLLCLHPKRHVFREYAREAGIDIMSRNPLAGMTREMFPFYPKLLLRRILEKTGLWSTINSIRGKT